MLENWIDKIRQVIKKMLGREKIRDVVGVDVAISDRMAGAIELWSKMYGEKAPWLNKTTQSCGLSAAIASEFARLVTLELKSEISGNDFLNEEYQEVISSIRQYCEYGCAKGGLALKPYVSNGHIEIDTIQADRFFPTRFNSRGEVTSAVFAESISAGRKVYTRIEYHQYENMQYSISNKAFVKNAQDDINILGHEITLAEVPEWADIQPETKIVGVERPLFAYFKIPNANNVDHSSPLGVSVYSRAVSDIREADKQWSRILWEYEGSELAIDADISMFRKEDDGTFRLPKGRERLFRLMDMDEDGEKYRVFSPNIRDESLFNGMNNILRRIEFNCGLAYGTLSDPDNVDKTAEEIKASKQRSYSTVSDIQRALQKALEHLIYAMDVLAQLSGLPGGKNYEVSFQWDDSIVTDKKSEREQDIQDVSMGVMRHEEYRAKWYGETIDQAKKNLPPQNTVME